MLSIQNAKTLEEVVQLLSSKIEESQHRNSKLVNITRHSKVWWNEDCCLSLKKYHLSQSFENWCNFKSLVKKSKCSFFDDKIEEIANKKSGPQELMNWVKKCKLPAIEAIQHKGRSCIELEDLWNTLHNSFNSAQMREVDLHVLDNIPGKSTKSWDSFSKQELIDIIEKCKNLFTPDPDKLTWSYYKK